MYEFMKNLVLRIFKVPPEPLDPMGDVASLKVFRASPNFFKYRLIVWIIRKIFSFFVLAFGAGIFISAMIFQGGHLSDSKGLLLFVFVALLTICMLWIVHLMISFMMLRLDYEMRWYKITDRSLRIREGIVFVREMTLTFANIQNISISQGPIQRLFGIADLKVETAGGGGIIQPDHNNQHPAFSMHIGIFKGIDNCDEVRDMMLARLKKLRDSGLGDADEAHLHNVPQAGAPALQPEIPGGDLKSILETIRSEAGLLRRSAESIRSNAD